jgi:hypothetical protein
MGAGSRDTFWQLVLTARLSSSEESLPLGRREMNNELIEWVNTLTEEQQDLFRSIAFNKEDVVSILQRFLDGLSESELAEYEEISDRMVVPEEAEAHFDAFCDRMKIYFDDEGNVR